MLKLTFGDGKIGMACYGMGKALTGVALTQHEEAHAIGEEDNSVIGLDVNDLNPVVVLEFKNSASAQVLIDMLVAVRDSLQVVETAEFCSLKANT